MQALRVITLRVFVLLVRHVLAVFRPLFWQRVLRVLAVPAYSQHERFTRRVRCASKAALPFT